MRKFYHRINMLLLLICANFFFAQAYTENFDNITTLTASGWFQQANSSPMGTNPTWFQGLPTSTSGPFDAYNGEANAYIAANHGGTGGYNGTISNWLLTPTRTLRNGDVFSFYTRKPTVTPGQPEYADRLEVRLSANGVSTNVGTTATSTGDFTTPLLTINPDLLPNVYPQVWTKYTISISGLSSPISGRIAFRYFVINAGPFGANSDYIGIDNVEYTPYTCPSIIISPSAGALPGASAGSPYSQAFTQTGGIGNPIFAITAGSLPPGLTLSSSGTISGTPTETGTRNFTLTLEDNNACSANQSYSITVGCALNPITISDFPSICKNSDPIALTQASPAGGTYSGTGVANGYFDPSAGSQTITYTYIDSYGCEHARTKLITVSESPVITSQPVETTVCKDATATFEVAANFATGYQWQVDQGLGFSSLSNEGVYSGATTNKLTITGVTANMGGYKYRVVAHGNCLPSITSQDVILKLTSITATTATSHVSCNNGANGSITLTPIGGTAPYTYNWGGGITTKDRSGLSAGQYSVIITDANGCSGTVTAVVTQPSAIVISGTQNNVACYGDASGYIIVNATGGAGNYTYSWNTTPEQTTASASRLKAGTYVVTVTDANGCFTTQSFIITEGESVNAPTGATTQSFNDGDTLNALTVSGINIKWYASESDAASHNEDLPMNTPLVNNTIYYATQTVGVCESKTSLPVRAWNPTLGVSNTNGKIGIQIYPNPVKEALNFSGNDKILKVIIVSQDGKKVTEKNMNGEKQLNVQSLVQGNYLINILTDKGLQTIKFIKN